MKYKCEKCGNTHDGSYGSGRFCSRKCANSRAHSKDTKLKIANSMKSYMDNHPEIANRIKKENKYANDVWIKQQRDKLFETNFNDLSEGLQRKRVILEQHNTCNICNLSLWNGKPIPLEIEHKDGNHHNNTRGNLEALCPNCHAQTDTWRGRNKRKKKRIISDEELVQAFLETSNIRQTLLKVGLSAKGTNYGRVKRALTLRGITYN